jgi:hypothetical protein
MERRPPDWRPDGWPPDDEDATPWRSPEGTENALASRTRFAQGFEAMAEFDRIDQLRPASMPSLLS